MSAFWKWYVAEANPLRLVVHRGVLPPLLKEGVADDLGGYLKIPWGTCQEGVSSMCLFPARPEYKILVALHLGIVRGPFWQWFTTRTLHCDPVCACVFMRTPETKVSGNSTLFPENLLDSEKACLSIVFAASYLEGWGSASRGERSGLLTVRWRAYCQVAASLNSVFLCGPAACVVSAWAPRCHLVGLLVGG